MSKNYFTDEQVKEAINKITPFKGHLGKRLLTEFELKNLMNLALEVAIGEPVAYCRSDTALDWKGQTVNIAIMFPSPKGLSNPMSLYSVKELEN